MCCEQFVDITNSDLSNLNYYFVNNDDQFASQIKFNAFRFVNFLVKLQLKAFYLLLFF